MTPEQAYLERLLHAHAAEDAFWYWREEEEEEDDD
jgi:hypothetical protein